VDDDASAFSVSCGLLTTTMGLAGLLAGIWAMLLGAVHILLYIFFRDIVEEDYSTRTVFHFLAVVAF